MIFSTCNTIEYHMSGKFIAESENWTHYTRDLTDYELMLVTEGTLYIAGEKEKFTVNKGEYLLMNPVKFQHGFKPSRCSFYWLHFWYSENETLANTISLPTKAKLSSPDRLIVLLKQLQDSDRRYQNQKLNSFLTAAILTELELQTASVTPLSSSNNPNGSLNSRETPYSQHHLLDSIKDYINWHLHENLKVWDIASYFGYNEKYLTTLFHKITGTALKQYILQTKMERAKIALSDTDQQIAQIAYSLGFDDSHNFSNAFKKVTGLSPSEYKLNYGKEKINREK